jgi:hypothetical protein
MTEPQVDRNSIDEAIMAQRSSLRFKLNQIMPSYMRETVTEGKA